MWHLRPYASCLHGPSAVQAFTDLSSRTPLTILHPAKSPKRADTPRKGLNANRYAMQMDGTTCTHTRAWHQIRTRQPNCPRMLTPPGRERKSVVEGNSLDQVSVAHVVDRRHQQEVQ